MNLIVESDSPVAAAMGLIITPVEAQVGREEQEEVYARIGVPGLNLGWREVESACRRWLKYPVCRPWFARAALKSLIPRRLR